MQKKGVNDLEMKSWLVRDNRIMRNKRAMPGDGKRWRRMKCFAIRLGIWVLLEIEAVPPL